MGTLKVVLIQIIFIWLILIHWGKTMNMMRILPVWIVDSNPRAYCEVHRMD
jgi:hypothetical protein